MKSKILVFLLVSGFMLVGATNSAFATSFKLPTWYDNDKAPTYGPDGDSLMCWAASAANALSWTGWTGGLASSDDIWGHFKDHFSNEGLYSALWGVQWFFDGVSRYPTWGDATTDGSGGGFYTGEDFWSMAGYLDNGMGNTDLEILQGMDAWLHNSAGVMLNIVKGEFGHAVTVWGYEFDDGSGEYTSLWITDPDSNLPSYTELDGLIEVLVNQNTGQLTDYLDGSWYISGAQWLAHSAGGIEPGPGPSPGEPVPEPATLLLFGSGLIGLFGIGRRKFKTS